MRISILSNIVESSTFVDLLNLISPLSVQTMIKSSILLAVATVLILKGAACQKLITRTLYSRHRELELGYRLHNDTRPLHYDLEIITDIHLNDEDDPRTFRFLGNVVIIIIALQDTSTITLHAAKDLHISAAKLKALDSTILQHWTEGEVSYDLTFELLTFELDQELKINDTVTLAINFEGNLGDRAGFYRSSYVNKRNESRWLATTHFEPTDARSAFPCYDEPGIRAPIKLTIAHGQEYTAIANMPFKTKTTGGLYTTTVFEETPPMPVYLLAFLVSDFSYVEIHADPPQRVFARPEAIENGDADFAVRAGVNVLQHIDEYFGVNYTENHVKIDQVAIPGFFAGVSIINVEDVAHRLTIHEQFYNLV